MNWSLNKTTEQFKIRKERVSRNRNTLDNVRVDEFDWSEWPMLSSKNEFLHDTIRTAAGSNSE